MFWWDRLIDDKIKSAQEQGLFDGLRGAGKPLPDDGEDLRSPDWLGHHLLREAGLLPTWLQLRKEIAEERPAVVQALAEFRAFQQRARPGHRGDRAILERLAQHYVRLARAINAKIDEHNYWCPVMSLELVRFQEDLGSRRRD